MRSKFGVRTAPVATAGGSAPAACRAPRWRPPCPASSTALEVADLDLRRHVETCLRCQAELAQYRKVLRTLHQLRTELLEPAPGLLPDILVALEAAGERGAMKYLLTGRRAAYLGGIAAATAAGAAGAIVLASRRHRRVAVAS